MNLNPLFKLFSRHEGYQNFSRAWRQPECLRLDDNSIRSRALVLAETHEPRSDRFDLEGALSELSVDYDVADFRRTACLMAYLTSRLFRDISKAPSDEISRKIQEFQGPRFFFVNHSSYFDYIHASNVSHRLGLPAPITHVTGSVTGGWAARWLKGFRALKVKKTLTPLGHRAYSWFSAALAEINEPQVLFARTSRYTVRSRDGILREPYVPHAVLSGVKATGKALVIPVSISYSIIPDDSYLTAPWFFPVLSMFPGNRLRVAPFVLGLRSAEKTLSKIDGVFGDVSVGFGDPFELAHDNRLSLQRISHRAIEEIAKNKLIQPSHLVAKSLHGHDKTDLKALRDRFRQEIENTSTFFRTRYRKSAPFHPLIVSDVPQAVNMGLRTLSRRGAISSSVIHRTYSPKNESLLSFYAYHADRRIYPLRGRNTLTVINAGAWGYTIALLIGMNLLKKEELSEHSLILYDSREEIIEKLTVEGKHPFLFKDITLPRSVRPEADLIAAVGDTSLILIVTPSKYFYSTMTKVVELAPDGSDLVIATKGFIPETGLLPCQTVREELERLGKRMRVSALSGANLAHEIVYGGAGVTQVACESYETFERMKPLIDTNLFRLVHSRDVIGTTLAAALKNVYAIGYGILEGSKLAPENFLATYATLVTSEIRDFGSLLGASPETFDAESQVWMADLLATCKGGRSASFGRDLAQIDEKQGKTRPAKALMEQYRKKKIAVEGFEASRFAQRIAAQRGFHPLILGEIYSILHGGKKIDVQELMEKCLDTMDRRVDESVLAPIRSRPVRY